MTHTYRRLSQRIIAMVTILALLLGSVYMTPAKADEAIPAAITITSPPATNPNTLLSYRYGEPIAVTTKVTDANNQPLDITNGITYKYVKSTAGSNGNTVGGEVTVTNDGGSTFSFIPKDLDYNLPAEVAFIYLDAEYTAGGQTVRTPPAVGYTPPISNVRLPIDLVADVKVAQEKLPVGAKNVTVTVKTAPQGNGYKITNTSGIRSSTGGALKDNSGNNIPASAAQGSGTLALTSDGQYCEATFTVPIPTDLQNREGTYRVQFRNGKYATFDIANTVPADTTPPVLADGYPKADNVTAATADLMVKMDESGKSYYVVLPQTAQAPTAAQVKAGKDGADNAATIAGSGAFAAGAEQKLSISGLAANTAYNVYMVAEDSAAPPNATDVKSVSFTTSSAEEAPFTFSPGYPKAGVVTGDTVQLFVKTDRASKAYYVALPQTEAAPTAAQVKAGQNSADQPSAIAGSGDCPAGEETPLSFGGLAVNTAYNVYVIAEDTATPPHVTALATVPVSTEPSAGSSAWSQAGQNPGQTYQGTTAGPAGTPGLKWSDSYFLRNYTAIDKVSPVLLPDGGFWHAVTTKQGAYTALLTNPGDGAVEENETYTSLLAPVSKDPFFYGVVPAGPGKQKIRKVDTTSGAVTESANEYFLFQNYQTARDIQYRAGNYYPYSLQADEHGIYVLNCLESGRLNDDNTQFQAGRYEVVALNFDLTERWHYELPTGYSASASPVIGKDGSVYLLTWKEAWVPSSLGGYNNRIQDYQLLALTANGQKKWQTSDVFDGYDNSFANKEGVGAIAGLDGTLYVITGNMDGFGLYQLKDNGDSPTKIWSQSLQAYQIKSAAVANDNTLYVATDQYKILAYNGADGSQKWSYKTSALGNIANNLVIDRDGIIYAGTDRNAKSEVIALKPDGTLKWSYTVPTNDRFSNDTELMLGNGGMLHALTRHALYGIDGSGRTPSISITEVNRPQKSIYYYTYGDTELRVKAAALENGQPVTSGITWYYQIDETVYPVTGNGTEMGIHLPSILEVNKLGSVYALYGGAKTSVGIKYVPNVPLFKKNGIVTTKNAYEPAETINASATIKGRHGEAVTTGVTWFYTLDAPLNTLGDRSVDTEDGSYGYVPDLTPSAGVEKVAITGEGSNTVSFPAPATGKVMYLYASYDGVASPPKMIDLTSGELAPPSITKAAYDSMTGRVNVEGTVAEKGLTLKLTFTPKSGGTSSVTKEFTLGDTLQYRVAVDGLAAGNYDITAASKRSKEDSSYVAGIGAPVFVTVPAGASDKQLIQAALDRTVKAYEKELPARQGKFNDWEVLALGTAGQNMQARKWLVDGKGYAYWRASDIAADKWGYNTGNAYPTTDLERIILGVLGAGYDPRNFNGTNLVAKLAETQYPSGNFSTQWGAGKRDDSQGNTQIFGIIALDAAKATKAEGYDAEKAVQRLLAMQGANGSFSWTGDVGEWASGDIDSTGMALTALGPHRDMPGVQAAINKTVAWLQSQQKAHGGFSGWGVENYPNPESSAWVIQGLIACGLDPLAPEWKKESGSLLTSLLEAQLEDGTFSHSTEPGKKSPNGMTTEQALLTLGDLANGTSKYSHLWSANLPSYTLRVEQDEIPNRNDIAVTAVTTQLQKGTEQPVKIQVDNKQTKAQSVTLLIGIYNKDTKKMQDYKFVTKSIGANATEIVEQSISIPATGNFEVKAFLWDTLDDMNILLERPQELPVAS